MKKAKLTTQNLRAQTLNIFVLIVCSLFLSGCVAAKPIHFVRDQYNNIESSIKKTIAKQRQPVVPGPDLAAADLPAYKEGTTFVYSDRTWEKVDYAADGLVAWVDYRGNRSSGPQDIIFRRSDWQSKTRVGHREFKPFKSIFFEQPESLWPLETGKKFNYTENGKWSEKKKPESVRYYTTDWHCSVKGTERIAVLAGEFDTWKIRCTRYSYSSRSEDQKAREAVLWNYAPEINHFVLKTHNYFYKKPQKRVELAAILPPEGMLPEKADKLRKETIQKALEFNKSGANEIWSVSENNASGSITPTGTFKLAGGNFCRQYVEDLNYAGSPDRLYSLACRTGGKEWVVPMR